VVGWEIPRAENSAAEAEATSARVLTGTDADWLIWRTYISSETHERHVNIKQRTVFAAAARPHSRSVSVAEGPFGLSEGALTNVSQSGSSGPVGICGRRQERCRHWRLQVQQPIACDS
jgi:hypothetical protein